MLNENRSPLSKLFKIWKDFCKLIRGHENLYECLLKIKNTILNNKIIVFYVILIYYLYQPKNSN
jgi:hypothetical protein